jgi:hypothetical protein
LPFFCQINKGSSCKLGYRSRSLASMLASLCLLEKATRCSFPSQTPCLRE